MEERNIGIGQLFQHFKTLPSFRLLRAGRRLVSLHDRSSESGDLSYSLEEEGPSSEKSTFSHTKTGKVPVLLPTDQSNNYDYTSESSSSGGDGNGSDNKDAADMYSIWREYELFSEHLHCRFVERFSPNFLNLGLSPSL